MKKKFVDRQIKSHVLKGDRFFDLNGEKRMQKEMLIERIDEKETTLEQLKERKLDIIEKIIMKNQIKFSMI